MHRPTAPTTHNARRILLATALGMALTLPGAFVTSTAASAAAATDGTPDTTFTTNVGTGFDSAVSGLLLQSTGKVIAFGGFTTLNSQASASVARLNADGTPDTAFTANLGTGLNDVVRAGGITSDDKIVIGGCFTTLNAVTTGHIARLNADGTPDTTFNASLGAGFDDQVWAIKVLEDDSLLVAGKFTTYKSVPVARIVHIGTDGALDTAFNTAIGTGPNDIVSTIAVQEDGKILIGGSFTSLASVSVGHLARLNANGSPDTTFNTALGAGLNAEPHAITVLADGGIAVGGAFTLWGATPANYQIFLTSAGGVDTNRTGAFGSGGLDGAVWAIHQQHDGRIVLAGAFLNKNSVASPRIIRLNNDYTWDTTFATNQGTGINDEIYALAFQADGSIVVGGYFDKVNEVASSRIGRLQNNDPTPLLTPSGADTSGLVLVAVMLLVAGSVVLVVRRRTVGVQA